MTSNEFDMVQRFTLEGKKSYVFFLKKAHFHCELSLKNQE